MKVAARNMSESSSGRNGDASTRNGNLAAAAGVLGALGVVSTCCLLPLVLTTLGVGALWVGNVTALAPYKPVLAVSTAVLLGYGYYCLYWRSKGGCRGGAKCSPARSDWLTKIGLWLATLLFAVGLAFDSYIEPLLTS